MNWDFWGEIYEYLDSHYDLSKVKKIYVNSDGGSWIRSGMRRIAGVIHALDEFHLKKYLTKLTNHITRRHIVGGINRTLISEEMPLRLCRIGTDRRLLAE